MDRGTSPLAASTMAVFPMCSCVIAEVRSLSLSKLLQPCPFDSAAGGARTASLPKSYRDRPSTQACWCTRRFLPIHAPVIGDLLQVRVALGGRRLRGAQSFRKTRLEHHAVLGPGVGQPRDTVLAISPEWVCRTNSIRGLGSRHQLPCQRPSEKRSNDLEFVVATWSTRVKSQAYCVRLMG